MEVVNSGRPPLDVAVTCLGSNVDFLFSFATGKRIHCSKQSATKIVVYSKAYAVVQNHVVSKKFDEKRLAKSLSNQRPFLRLSS